MPNEIIVAGHFRLGGGGGSRAHFQDYVYSEEGVSQTVAAWCKTDPLRLLIRKHKNERKRDSDGWNLKA